MGLLAAFGFPLLLYLPVKSVVNTVSWFVLSRIGMFACRSVSEIAASLSRLACFIALLAIGSSLRSNKSLHRTPPARLPYQLLLGLPAGVAGEFSR